MTTEERDFLESLAIGAACRALPVRKKLPIAYSYNGVVLPELPEWDRERYPYAYIVKDLDRTEPYEYAFCMERSPKYVNLRTDAFAGTVSASDWTGRYYGYENNAWTSGLGAYVGSVIWSNADVYYKDSSDLGDLAGTLYLAASEPIPVYE